MSDNMLSYQEERMRLESEIGGLKENISFASSNGESAPKDSVTQPEKMDAEKENAKENTSNKARQQKKEPLKPATPKSGFGVMRTSVLKDNGDLLRDTNAELAARPYFKIFQPQVYGNQNYVPYKDIKATVTGMGKYERLGIDGTIGPDTNPQFDMVDVVLETDKNILPRLKLVQSWVSNVRISISIDSPTAHRDWLKRDDGTGTRAQKVKLNNLLRALFDLESQVTFFFHKYPALNAQKIKFVKASMLGAISSFYKVTKSIIVPLFAKLRPLLVNINLLWDNNSFQCIHVPNNQTRDDDSSDEEVKNEGPAGRPANSMVLTPEQVMNMLVAALFMNGNKPPTANGKK